MQVMHGCEDLVHIMPPVSLCIIDNLLLIQQLMCDLLPGNLLPELFYKKLRKVLILSVSELRQLRDLMHIMPDEQVSFQQDLSVSVS